MCQENIIIFKIIVSKNICVNKKYLCPKKYLCQQKIFVSKLPYVMKQNISKVNNVADPDNYSTKLFHSQPAASSSQLHCAAALCPISLLLSPTRETQITKTQNSDPEVVLTATLNTLRPLYANVITRFSQKSETATLETVLQPGVVAGDDAGLDWVWCDSKLSVWLVITHSSQQGEAQPFKYIHSRASEELFYSLLE